MMTKNVEDASNGGLGVVPGTAPPTGANDLAPNGGAKHPANTDRPKGPGSGGGLFEVVKVTATPGGADLTLQDGDGNLHDMHRPAASAEGLIGRTVHIVYYQQGRQTYVATLDVEDDAELSPGKGRRYQRAWAYQYLKRAMARLENPAVHRLCNRWVEDERFATWPGAKRRHHGYPGGLMVHTAEVMAYALQICEARPCRADLQVLIPAVVYHDVGKLADYVVTEHGDVEYTEHVELVQHLSRSYAEWFTAANEMGLDPTYRDTVAHAILAHHGRHEWGSPVAPATPEATVIHFADMLSRDASYDKHPG